MAELMDRLRKAVAATVLLTLLLSVLPGRGEESPPLPAVAQAQAVPGPPKEPADKAQPPPKEDIFGLDIERLGTIPARVSVASGFSAPVSTVSRELDLPVAPARAGAPTVGTSPAAVYVITAEDIRRSGMRTIPDLLRMVPGVDVARIDANKWAISIRGFNTQFANKLLVLIDGRDVYSPVFGGTLWDERDLLIEDVERIEVIRGPGATLWGANAVNGVINIITKNAQDTQGGIIYGGGGSEPRSMGAVRYGGKLGDNAFYRFYVKYFTYGNGVDIQGNPTGDAWDSVRSGFRVDWAPSSSDAVMFEGDLFSGDVGSTVPVPIFTPPFSQQVNVRDSIAGGYLLNRWTHRFSDTSGIELRAYYDHTDRRFPASIREVRDLVDFDLEGRFQLTDRQQIVWGAGYRWTTDDIEESPLTAFEPSHRTLNLSSSFIQDSITLVKDRLQWIVGSKFEHNDFTGYEIQPSTRVLWTPTNRQTLWGAISRAVRTPTRGDTAVLSDVSVDPPGTLFPGSPATLNRFIGNPNLLSEEMIAYEIGYRASPTERFSYDIALFVNNYQDVHTSEPGVPFLVLDPVPHLVLPLSPGNNLAGDTYGAEIAASWKPTDWWQLNCGYTLLQMHLHLQPGSLDVLGATVTNGQSPRNEFNLRSYMNLSRHWEFDAAMYFVDDLPAFNVPSYTRFDVRLGWHPSDNLELVLGLQNLQQAEHPEFRSTEVIVVPSQAPRSIYGLLRWRF
jgi:iron complex outermembrane receptor protein